MIGSPTPSSPTPVQGVPGLDRVAPSAPTPSRVPGRQPRRRLGRYASPMLALVVLVGACAAIVRIVADGELPEPILFAPSVVYPPIRLDGALVRGMAREWAVNHEGPLRYGVPVPVELTAYCLQGTTRRGRYVRQGIVAADPKLFPLARYLEIYVGRTYWGRFLIDDTGGAIKENRLDIWTPTCREARIFGRQQGTAVLVPRPRGAKSDTLLTGRLGGAIR